MEATVPLYGVFTKNTRGKQCNAMLPHLSLDNQLAPDKHSDAPQRPPGPVIPSDEILNWQKQALSRHRDIIMPVQEKMKGKINI